MNDKCREEFEKWYRASHDGYSLGKGLNGKYRSTCAQWAWVGWEAARKAGKPTVTRDGWLTESQIEYISEINSHCEPGVNEVVALCSMASAAISLHAERAALVEKLRAVIDTIEGGSV